MVCKLAVEKFIFPFFLLFYNFFDAFYSSTTKKIFYIL